MAETQRLELGCGRTKAEGFIGVDRFPLKGVDVVADLDGPLPFADSSFDLVLCFHSLEHFASVINAVREIWRVCRPGAQVVIAAPYATMQLNLANPWHLQAFNEHTPRFWTRAATSGLAPVEWQQPPLGTRWGLAASDNSNPDFDMRTLKIEFFYFSEFARLPAHRQRYARRHYLDSCEQILYHLVAFKPPMKEKDLARLELDLYDPPRLAARRQAALQAAPKPWLRWLTTWRNATTR